MALRSISPEELFAHSSFPLKGKDPSKGQDCWIALHGLVLKVDAKTLQEHPGGAQSILRVAGQDCTQEFEDAGHSDFAREWCNRLEVVGRLVAKGSESCARVDGAAMKIPSVRDLEGFPRAADQPDSCRSTAASSTTSTSFERTSSAQERGEVPLRIARMFVYPIKACAGVEVDRCIPTQHGFAHDREYVFAAEQAVMATSAGESEGEGESSSFLKLLVPYDLPALAWIQPSLPTDDGMRIELLNSGDDEIEGIGSTCSFFVPRIASEGMCSAEGDSAPGGGKMKYINMYKKCLLAGIDQGDAVSARVTNFLNKQHPGVLLPTTKVRLLLLTDRKLLHSETVHTGYYLQPRGSNYTPFMFMREETIKAVNEKFFPGEPLRVTTLRFRPNVVFREEDCHFDSDWDHRREQDEGEVAANLDWSFCEDSWESISMRHHPSRFLQVLKSCGRCSHIFVNPARAICDGDFLQKELCRLGRDGQGMIRKLESKLVQGVKNVSVNVNGLLGVDVGGLAASVDPVLPWFRNHYQKFLDAGRTTKVFLGLCGSFHSLSGPQFCAGDNAFHVGQEWVANLSIRSLKEYGAEMLRPCQDNRAVINKTRPIDLICAYGPDARGTIVRDGADEGEDPFTSSQPPVFLPESRAARNTRRQVTVTEIVELSPTAKRIRLSFVKNGSLFRKDNVGSYAPPALGLPCGHHIAVFGENPAFARSHWNHKRQTDAEKLPPTIKRSFTPIRCGRGYFDLVVKMYRKQEQQPEGSNKSPISCATLSSTSSSNSQSIPFPDGGRLTGHFLDRLVVNDVVQIAGPFGHIRYVGGGRFRLGEERRFSQVGMVAGGSGITPMVQVLQFAAAERDPPFRARLVYANKDENDVLCKELLEGERCRRVLAECDAKYVISARGERISEDILRRSLPPPGAESLVLLCGPPGMVEAAREYLRKIGHEDAQVHEF